MIDKPATLTALLASGALLLAGVASFMIFRSVMARMMQTRVLAVALTRSADEPPAKKSSLGSVRGLFYWVGETIRQRTSFYSKKDIAGLENMIASAGLQPRTLLPVLLGIKVVAVVAVPLAAFLYARAAGLTDQHTWLMSIVAVPFGLLGPDWMIGFARRPFLAALRRGVPDALDLLVVCSEAGMGLETALEQVSREMEHSNVAMSLALSRLLDDMRVLPDRREALRNFGDNTGVQGARRVASVLSQAIKYGTPLSQALRAVANDLRRERMIALEAKASKLPALLTLPLILFIMPSLFIVLVGPALLTLGPILGKMGGH